MITVARKTLVSVLHKLTALCMEVCQLNSQEIKRYFPARSDLCRDNNVDGYPQMNLYRDGQFVDTYKKARDFELITAYLDEHIEPKETSTPEPTPTPVPSPPVVSVPTPDTRELIAETFKLPDEKTYNSAGNVVILNEKSFTDTVAEGHVFVKFYAPWYVLSPSPFRWS